MKNYQNNSSLNQKRSISIYFKYYQKMPIYIWVMTAIAIGLLLIGIIYTIKISDIYNIYANALNNLSNVNFKYIVDDINNINQLDIGDNDIWTLIVLNPKSVIEVTDPNLFSNAIAVNFTDPITNVVKTVYYDVSKWGLDKELSAKYLSFYLNISDGNLEHTIYDNNAYIKYILSAVGFSIGAFALFFPVIGWTNYILKIKPEKNKKTIEDKELKKKLKLRKKHLLNFKKNKGI